MGHSLPEPPGTESAGCRPSAPPEWQMARLRSASSAATLRSPALTAEPAAYALLDKDALCRTSATDCAIMPIATMAHIIHLSTAERMRAVLQPRNARTSAATAQCSPVTQAWPRWLRDRLLDPVNARGHALWAAHQNDAPLVELLQRGAAALATPIPR